MAIQSKTVVSSMLWKLMERFSSQVVSFIISIILARILLPYEYGIIAIIIIFINLANVIIDGGLNTALIQKKNADQIDFSTIFWFSLLLALVLYGALFWGAPLIAKFYHNDVLVPVIRVLSIVIFFNSFNSIQRAYVSKHMLFKKLFWVNAIALIISGGIGIWMAYSGCGVWALVGQTLVSSITCCIVMWIAIRWRPSLIFSTSNFKGLFSYGWKIFLTNFIIAIYEDIRGLIIGKVYQPATLAYFDRGKSLPNLLMSNFTNSINTVLLPTFSEEQDDKTRVKQMVRRSNQISYFVVLPLLVGFIFAAKNVILVLFTEKWEPAVPFAQIFCVAFALMPIQNVNMTAIKSLGYSNITLRLEIIKKIIEAVILVVSFLINVFAVAWGIVLYNFVCIFINMSPCKKLIDYGWKEQVTDIIPIMVTSLIMGGAVWLCSLLPLSGIILLLIQIVAGIVIYIILSHIMNLESYLYLKEYVKKSMPNIMEMK